MHTYVPAGRWGAQAYSSSPKEESSPVGWLVGWLVGWIGWIGWVQWVACRLSDQRPPWLRTAPHRPDNGSMPLTCAVGLELALLPAEAKLDRVPVAGGEALHVLVRGPQRGQADLLFIFIHPPVDYY